MGAELAKRIRLARSGSPLETRAGSALLYDYRGRLAQPRPPIVAREVLQDQAASGDTDTEHALYPTPEGSAADLAAVSQAIADYFFPPD